MKYISLILERHLRKSTNANTTPIASVSLEKKTRRTNVELHVSEIAFPYSNTILTAENMLNVLSLRKTLKKQS